MGTEMMATNANSHEIQIIIPTVPTMVSTPVSSWLIDCCMLCDTLSMSLVTRLSTSPRACWSRCHSGIACSLASTSARSRNIVRCTTPASRYACRYDSRPPTVYKPMANHSVRCIAAKSTPGPPEDLLRRPSNRMLVAWPSTFGPITTSDTLMNAITSTSTTWARSGERRRPRRLTELLKSFDFSIGTPTVFHRPLRVSVAGPVERTLSSAPAGAVLWSSCTSSPGLMRRPRRR